MNNDRMRSTFEGGSASGGLAVLGTLLIDYLKDIFPGQPTTLWALLSGLVAFVAGGALFNAIDRFRYRGGRK